MLPRGAAAQEAVKAYLLGLGLFLPALGCWRHSTASGGSQSQCRSRPSSPALRSGECAGAPLRRQGLMLFHTLLMVLLRLKPRESPQLPLLADLAACLASTTVRGQLCSLKQMVGVQQHGRLSEMPYCSRQQPYCGADPFSRRCRAQSCLGQAMQSLRVNSCPFHPTESTRVPRAR